MSAILRVKPELTEILKCAHCRNISPMTKCATYSDIETVEDVSSGQSWEEGNIFDVLKCPSCKKIMFTSAHYHEAFEYPEDFERKILYPANETLPFGLPDHIRKAYEAAIAIRSIDANAYGVMVGRVLEQICIDRSAKGSSLYDKIADLAKTGEIPDNLVAVADSLRTLRNVGAHAGLGELTASEVPIVSSLARAILEYVYSAPHLARIAQGRLAELKKKKKAKGKRA
jgi:Domain of unknown function (DUF4145)